MRPAVRLSLSLSVPLLLLLSLPLPLGAQTPQGACGYSDTEPGDPSWLSLSYWQPPSGLTTCSASGTVTVPKGRKFVVFEVSEGYQWISASPPPPSSVSVTIDGPDSRLLSWSDAQGPGAAGGVPAWTSVCKPWNIDGNDLGIVCGFHRLVAEFIDVSSLTQAAPVQLNVQLQASGVEPRIPLQAYVTVNGDVQFTLSQTPKSFRPEDARDDAAISQCTGGPGDNCRPQYTIHARNWPFSTDDVTVTYDFTLAHPSQIAGQPATSWLKGSSTNWGTDDVNVPDYVFDTLTDAQLTAPDPGGLHLASIASVDTSQDVKLVVKSQDYGGSAILKPNVVVKGPGIAEGSVTLPFSVVDENGDDVKPPDCADASGFLNHPFASLPVDQDCNGIADDWEQNHGGPFKDPKADAEPGALGAGTPDAYKGDGFAVLDEYRGFHMLDDQGNTVWHDTDPRVQDLFYWDPDGLLTNTINKKNPQSGNHLLKIFGAQTGGFMTLHRVNAKQAHATDPNDGTQPLDPLNSNSPFFDSDGPRGFAVFYVDDDSLPKTDLGDSGNPDDLNDPEAYRNAGTLPIRISLKNIKDKANAVWAGNSAAYASTLLDEVVAHETGHRLGRRHRERVAIKVPFDKDAMDSLALGQFMQNPAVKRLGQLFIAQSIYALSTRAGFQANEIKDDETILSLVPSGAVWWPGNPVGQPKPPVWPYRHKIDQRVPIDSVRLESQDGTIMCWTPKLDQAQDSEWMFASDDLNGLCLSADGCDSEK